MTKNLDIEGLSSIADNYQLFYIDLWGVIHNGIKLHDEAVNALKEITKMNKNYVTVEEAIFDLPFTKSGQGEFKSKYDKKPITEYQKKMRRNAKSLYNHISTLSLIHI